MPIAEVEFAGIDSKGAVCENQLIPLKEEFTAYRKTANLWESKNLQYEYQIKDSDIVKLLNGQIVELINDNDDDDEE